MKPDTALVIKRGPTCLTGRDGDEYVAVIQWRDIRGCWYVESVWAAHSRYFVPMLVEWRKVWSERGNPRMSFHTADDNAQMQRLARMLGATRKNQFYRIERLPLAPINAGNGAGSPRGNDHEADQRIDA